MADNDLAFGPSARSEVEPVRQPDFAAALGPKGTAALPTASSSLDQAATHAYIAASPQHAAANLAPIPWIAQKLLGHTSGLQPVPWFAQRVLGLGPPGTPVQQAAPTNDMAAPPSQPMSPSNLLPQPVDVSPLAPVGGP